MSKDSAPDEMQTTIQRAQTDRKKSRRNSKSNLTDPEVSRSDATKKRRAVHP
jgi:hypothetical protein